MADQQKGVTLQIVAADELLLQKLILLGGERPCESLRGVRDILATNQAGELRKLFGPSQFGEQGTQKDEPVDLGGGGEGGTWERRRDIQSRRCGSRRS